MTAESVWVMCPLSLQRFPYWLKASPHQFIQLMETTAVMSRRVTPPKLEERHQCSLAPPLAQSTAPDTHRYPPPPAWLSLCLKLSSHIPTLCLTRQWAVLSSTNCFYHVSPFWIKWSYNLFRQLPSQRTSQDHWRPPTQAGRSSTYFPYSCPWPSGTGAKSEVETRLGGQRGM